MAGFVRQVGSCGRSSGSCHCLSTLGGDVSHAVLAPLQHIHCCRSMFLTREVSDESLLFSFIRCTKVLTRSCIFHTYPPFHLSILSGSSISHLLPSLLLVLSHVFWLKYVFITCFRVLTLRTGHSVYLCFTYSVAVHSLSLSLSLSLSRSY